MKQSTIQLIDTHCHIHDPDFTTKYKITVEQMISNAKNDGITHFVCIGTDISSSKTAQKFCSDNADCSYSIALHPHEAAKLTDDEVNLELTILEKLAKNGSSKLVGIGECGLDYYYHQSKEVKDRQKKLLIGQLKIAKKYDLPLIFHIREAFSEFFAILDEHGPVRGVVHSFTSNIQHMQESVKRGLYISLNGIMTFTKDQNQLEAARLVPKSNLVIETDAPFLTPAPFRGTMCEIKHVRVTAEFLCNLRGESLEELSKYTTANAKELFKL